MRKSEVTLTHRLVEKLKPGEKNLYVWDHDVPGFGVTVTPAGSKLLVVKTSVLGHREWHTLGKFPYKTIEAARYEAQGIKDKARKGEDPKAAVRALKEAPTVKELALRFMAEHVTRKRKAGTVREYQSIVDGHILPKLGKLRVRDVDRAIVAKLHHGMKDAPIRANRTLAVLGKMMAMAEAWGFREQGTNPCRGIEKNAENKRQRFLSDAEFHWLGKAMVKAEEDGENPSGLAALHLLLYTGMRKDEVLSLKWPQVDLENGVLALTNHKTSRHSGTKYVHLNPQALQLLNGMSRFINNPFVFGGALAYAVDKETGKESGHLVNLSKVWGRIKDLVPEIQEAEEIPEQQRVDISDVRIHDLRHSFAAVAAGGGFSLPIIGAMLGHSQPATTARYAHLGANPLAEASNATGAKIAAAMGGKA